MRGECSWSAFVDTPTVPVTGRGHGIKSPESRHVWGGGGGSGECVGRGAYPLGGQGGCGMQHPQ